MKKNVKRAAVILMAVLMLVTAIPMNGIVGTDLFASKASAAELAPTGQCGENAYWTFDSETGLLTISGEGEMSNYLGSNSPFFGNSSIKNIVIDNRITNIGDWIFYRCTGITDLTIGNGIMSIGEEAFRECTGLTSITIPDGVTSIEYHAFYYCKSLTSITIGNGVTDIDKNAFNGTSYYNDLSNWENDLFYIGDYLICSKIEIDGEYSIKYGTKYIGNGVFEDCSGITNITIPDGITDIGDSAFRGCKGLTNIEIPDSVMSIGDYAFCGCTGLISITVPNSVTNIGEHAFNSCSGLVDITIPNSVSSIGSFVFRDCIGLTNVTIGNGVKDIGEGAFYGCNKLTSITIPDNVTSIECSAFSNCTSLTSISVSKENKVYDSRKNCNAIIETETNTLIYGIKNTVIPDSVTSIGKYAFYNCTGLTSITIPDSVTSIGDFAFEYCKGLTNIVIPGSVTSTGYYAFDWCAGLTSLTIETGVKIINTCAFNCCQSLSSIIIPDSVTEIDDYAFGYCSSLTDVYYSGTKYQWNSISVGINNNELLNATIHYNYGKTSGECGENINWVFDETDGSLLISGTGAMNSFENIEDYGWSNVKDSINYVEVSDGITGIGANAFLGCNNINEVFFGDSVTDIGADAFADCTSLALVTVTSGGFNAENAFSNNDSKLTFIVSDSNSAAKNFADANGIPVISASYSDGTIGFSGGTIIYNDLQYNYLTNFINKYSSAEHLYFDSLEFDGINPDFIIIDDCENIDLTAKNFTLNDLTVSINVVINGVKQKITFAQMFELLESGNYDAFSLSYKSDDGGGEKTFFEKVIDFFEEITTSALSAISRAINTIVKLFKKK